MASFSKLFRRSSPPKPPPPPGDLEKQSPECWWPAKAWGQNYSKTVRLVAGQRSGPKLTPTQCGIPGEGVDHPKPPSRGLRITDLRGQPKAWSQKLLQNSAFRCWPNVWGEKLFQNSAFLFVWGTQEGKRRRKTDFLVLPTIKWKILDIITAIYCVNAFIVGVQVQHKPMCQLMPSQAGA